MGYWVRFAADGTPDYHGSAQIDGAEWIADKTDAELCALRRVDGKWLPREAREPTPAELADILRAEMQAAALMAVQAAEDREDRIANRCIRLLIRRQLGQITQAQFVAAVAAIRAAVEAEA